MFCPRQYMCLPSLHCRKHSPAVPLERKPLCVEQSDFNGAQHYCWETLD